ncbi:MAG: hypothetical protein U0103_04940 [Candidatus Obscuribacterales bacterium]|nr:hypothetical protein [Cyanobacteria bacterium SZAS LIN-5]
MKLTEEQILCFSIGGIGTGLWLTFLVSTTDAVLDLLNTDAMSINLWQTFAVYGLEGGLVGLSLEFVSRKLILNNRRIWLTFLIPQVSFAVAAVTVALMNILENHSRNLSLLEIDTVLVYAGAALVFSFAAVGALIVAGHLQKNVSSLIS